MSELLDLEIAVFCAVIGGITMYRFGPLLGAVAFGAACLFAKHKYDVHFGPHCKLTKSRAPHHMLMNLDLSLSDPSFRSTSVWFASMIMASTLPATPRWCTWFLWSVWALLFYVSSWEFAVVVAFTSGLAYLFTVRS